MNKQSSVKSSGSLLERAAQIYDFGAALRRERGEDMEDRSPAKAGAQGDAALPDSGPRPSPGNRIAQLPRKPSPQVTPRHPAPSHARTAQIDRDRLLDGNFIVPDQPVSGLAEEFRIVKRQLLLAARGGKGHAPLERGERILICSANPDEGKTFSAINLALSMATEKDSRVLLVDADFAKPSVLGELGIEDGPGLMDALADENADVESFIVGTDIPGLSILPAGRKSNEDTEYLASARTEHVLERLSETDPSRIILFDSPPALAASHASVLALYVGQVLMVVRADETTEGALHDALGLLDGCHHIQLLLNSAKFSPTGRRFGSYYSYGA